MIRHAFTLAEVLITLGIIGVVAAMTLPSVINSTKISSWKLLLKSNILKFQKCWIICMLTICVQLLTA